MDGGWGDDWIAVWPDNAGDLYGGAGYDTLDYRAWNGGVHVSLDGNTNDGGPHADRTGQPVNGGPGHDICRGAGISRSGCELP